MSGQSFLLVKKAKRLKLPIILKGESLVVVQAEEKLRAAGKLGISQ